MVVPENGFVRLPPDSTGKKSAAAGRLILQCQDNTTYTFEVGQTIQGQNSGATAEIVGLESKGFSAGEIDLFCDLNTVVGTFQANENILVGATVYAKTKTTATLDQIYYQKNTIVDRDVPSHALKIDRNGDGFMRFDEGSPALSTFGGLLAEAPESSRQYVYAYDERPNEFYDVESGSGTLSYVSGERSILLDTNGTASGDLVTRQSHLYHPYQPGSMSKIMQTIVLGDTGKAGVRRRWGYFDEENGLYWELDGTTLYVVCRSNATGSVVEVRVAQEDWNRDQLDGTTDFNLDVTKTNLYWMDFQWLGIGVVRFGIYEQDGRKTTCHVFENPNNADRVYMRQGTLPVRYECENTDTAVSSSELKSICTVVQVAGTIKRQFSSFSATCTASTSVAFGDGEVPILAIKPKATFNGIVNHALTVPKEVHMISDPVTSSGIFNIRVRGLGFTSGGSFNGVSDNSFTEVNYNPTGFLSPATSGTVQYGASIKGGDAYEHQFENFTPHSQYSLLTSVLSDQTTRPEIVITAEAVSASATGDFFATMNFDEMVY
jgi:hypothetical protein